MNKSQFSEEQMVKILREADRAPVAEERLRAFRRSPLRRWTSRMPRGPSTTVAHWVFKAPTPTSSSARRGRTAQHHIVQRATAVGHSEPELVTDPGANDDLVTVAKARPDQDRYVIDELVREEVADAGPYRDIQRRRPRRRLGSESRNESHPSRALRRATIGGRGHRPRSLRREAAP